MAGVSCKVWLLLLLMSIDTVNLSHFRGGIIMSRPVPGGSLSEIEIFYFISWRRSSYSCDSQDIAQGDLQRGEGHLGCQYGCNGNIAPMSFICTSFSSEEDWTFGERHLTHDFSSLAGRTIVVGFTGNAWIAPISGRWNISTSFSLSIRNDTGRINSTPRATTAPVIRLLEGCHYTLSLPVSDPDGDIVRCRWAQGIECASACSNANFPGAILHSNTCVIEYQANRGTRYWAAALMIEDFTPGSLIPLSSVALQFLVLVVPNTLGSCSQVPVFVQPTILDGSCVAIPPGATFTTQLFANSSGSSASIVEIQTIPPLGTRVGQLTQLSESNTYFVNVTWTPSSGQQNETHPFCFTAVGSDGQNSDQACINLLPGYFPPAPLPATATPSQQLVHPSNNTTWRVRFNPNIERSSVMGSIKFHEYVSEEEIYSIDASQSREVTFEHLDTLLITPNFSFMEKTRYYITFDRHVVQGLEGCMPGNEPVLDKDFWRFETMDLTPPTISFLESTSVSNSNASFSMESNENVTWACVLLLDSMESTINCSGAHWSGYGLSEGSYMLLVRATDKAGNVGSSRQTFQIDQTPPTVIIMRKPSLISNERTPTLIFTCSERICSYDCYFTSNLTGRSPLSCSSGRLTTPVLQPNANYTFEVRATDQVGNQGESMSYMWETDFEAPHIFGIQNVSVLCNDTHPQNTGQAQAVDNIPESVMLTYSDTRVECSISRIWRATDTAGNVAQLVQNINLEFSPTVALLLQVSLSCDSAAASLEVPSNTASAPNPCGLPLQLVYEDSEQPACPGTFTRNWTVSGCGRSATAAQVLILYDLCPPHACGRNESIPQGSCSLGECQCNPPWHGENCDTIIYRPIAELVNDSILLEGQNYMTCVSVSQGSPPLTWTLVSGPRGLLIDQYTGQINWRRAQAGSHLVIVQVENQVGRVRVEWNLQVTPGYNARLVSVSSTLFPYAQPVMLNGYVEYMENNLIEEDRMGIVLVNIDIFANGATRTFRTYTSSSGNFSLSFLPVSTEYGSYTAGARHPSSLQSQPQVQWGILGMRSVPERISLNGEAISAFERTFQNASFVYNDGPGPLTGITTSLVLPNTGDIAINIVLRGFPSNNTLQPGERLAMDIQVATSRSLSGSFLISLNTREGTGLQLFTTLQIQPILPSLSIEPSSINARIVRGRSRIFEFNVTNAGRATAHNVRSVLPDTNVISLISFGNMQQSRGGNLNLEGGESALFSIRAQIPEMQQLGDIRARIVISSNEVFTSLPITLIVSSDSLMNLTVIVEDEYTYFANGRPLVSDATVTLVNYQRNLRLSQSTNAGNGSVEFTNIYEDRYEMFVEAPSHTTLQQIIVTSVESPTLTLFLERQAVTYTWSVTPVTYQDVYVISIEADFETHVPIPVVTVTPNEINLDDLEASLIDSLQINITNHGLIRADNVSIELPTHPFLEFSTSTELLGHLEPLSSVIVSVHFTRRSNQKRQAVSYALYLINFVYRYVCGEIQIRNIPVVLRQTEIIVSNPIDLRTRLIAFTPNIGSGGNSGGDGHSFTFNGFTTETPFFCDPCISAILECLAPTTLDLLLVPSCVQLALSGTNPVSSVSNALNWITCPVNTPFFDLILCAFDESLFSKCLRTTSRRKKRTVRRTLNELVEALYPIQQSIAIGTEVLGDDLWITIGDSQWLSNILRPALDDESEAGVLISAAELSTILTASPPNGTTTDIVERMAQRVNNTLFGWTSGQLEPSEGSNLASFSRVQGLAQNIDTYNTMAVDRGFSSYLDAYNFAAGELNQINDLEEEVGVCAVVRIRIEQELAITREAFLARLEIGNMEDSPLQQIYVDIIVTDLVTGSQATHLFSIGNETLSGSLTRSVDGSWLLPSGATGAVEWLIIPYSEAAPDDDYIYNVGGSFSYLVDGGNITVPFSPTPITVRPDPSLLVHYFWERNVVGDDPFTDEIEPSIPFTLGVVVKNAGFGTAYSLQISSAQPEIIENERGLLINFMIIGANIGGESASPSLTVTFGDLLPNTTAVARWFMISSLQGEFMSYSATFENMNPLGDPRLSILDDLQIHELIRNIDMYTSDEDDGILDFLVNDRNDLMAYPDVLYSSRTLEQHNVSIGIIHSVQTTSENMTLLLVVRASSNTTGWVYYRYEDTQDILQNVASSINVTKHEGNQTIKLPSQNSWITSDRDDTFYLHIVDRLDTTDEVAYMLGLCEVDCPTIDVEFTQPAVKLPTPSVTISILPRDVVAGAPLTLTCTVDFDPSLTTYVNVSLMWLRETSPILDNTDHVSILSSLSESQYISNLTLYAIAEISNFTCRAGIIPSSAFTSLIASDLSEDVIEIMIVEALPDMPTSADSSTGGNIIESTPSSSSSEASISLLIVVGVVLASVLILAITAAVITVAIFAIRNHGEHKPDIDRLEPYEIPADNAWRDVTQTTF